MALLEVALELLVLIVFVFLARREVRLSKNSAPVEAKVSSVEGDQVVLSFCHPNGEEVNEVFEKKQLKAILQKTFDVGVGDTIDAVCDTQDAGVLIPMSYEKYQKKYRTQKMPVFIVIFLVLFFSIMHNMLNIITG